MESGRKTVRTNCECCGNYVYDEENDYYICEANLDEDEMGRFLSNTMYQCPYYQSGDEYRIMCKQIQAGQIEESRIKKQIQAD